MLPNTMADDGQDQNDIIRGKRPCRISQKDIALATNGCFRFHKFRGSRCPASGEGFGCFDHASKPRTTIAKIDIDNVESLPEHERRESVNSERSDDDEARRRVSIEKRRQHYDE
ncbi:hypothetical protein GJ496_002311 [Pomphorhynchus laevis]|nr:hypothetical protein GJ496_002311 [Pomphorhynchus laevis]